MPAKTKAERMSSVPATSTARTNGLSMIPPPRRRGETATGVKSSHRRLAAHQPREEAFMGAAEVGELNHSRGGDHDGRPAREAEKLALHPGEKRTVLKVEEIPCRDDVARLILPEPGCSHWQVHGRGANQH